MTNLSKKNINQQIKSQKEEQKQNINNIDTDNLLQNIKNSEKLYKLGKDGELKVKKSLYEQIMSIHSHSLFRKSFIIVILIHLLLIIIPYTENTVFKMPEFINKVFSLFFDLWPFVKWTMGENGEYNLHKLVFKGLEISLMLLYVVDLLPKIIVWKKPFWWKLTNTIIIAMMVLQVPLTMRELDNNENDMQRIKFRIFSIGLSFILLCEILSIREQKSIRLKRIQNVLSQQKEQHNQLRKAKQQNQENLFITKKRNPNELPEIAWCEIVKHDKPGDCWIVAFGYVYDISDYVKNHPGGDIIYDGAGGECTHMWMAHHPQYLLDQGIPEQYKVGRVRDHDDFYNYEGNFYRELKLMMEKKIPKENRRNHWQLFVKGIIWFSLYIYCFYWYLTTLSVWSMICLAFSQGQVGINIQHDGNHIAYSNSKFSYLMGYTLDLIFSSSVIYRRSHDFGHHGCVNHYELDRAFDTSYPLIRLHNMQSRQWFHKYQHIYSWFVYGLVNWGDLMGTFDELEWLSNFPARRGFIQKKYVIGQYLTKIVWFCMMVVYPSYQFGFIAATKMVFFWMIVMSYSYATFFLVNHWTDESEFTDNSDVYNSNWGTLQVRNSTNFGLNNKFWLHLSGGLNLQIEHHLFPTLAHTRLPEIQEMVQEYCKKNNVRYFAYSNMFTAMYGHYKYLKKLGQQE
ncbi:Cytochrome b5-like heme/steroid binding domain [Pseudocohnilembus persalinus]|uniref:Cytochrome b5-like heme/steroid binding domain n=1 Tax=Pseudocohnilembus persalinus TaxID=266149 RepID=A0A0V0QS57_PSEPJ|nr:Cytochrome b5-like heme/steroid binding domain [Pseudocohnilembus persalinus]|eukprot:KRX05139.1 Cytochrome b5-like heme/steroid binding domain [Pseudocohnilembus persalinus]